MSNQITLNVCQFNTAKSLRDALSAVGVTGSAQDAILKESAGARHACRVEAAKAAAQKAANFIPSFTDEERDHRNARAAFLCLLDEVGVGGSDGCEGKGTARLPAFRSLGTGRKHARDGDAWSAAIKEAGAGLAPIDRVEAQPNGLIAVWVRDEEAAYEQMGEGHWTRSRIGWQCGVMAANPEWLPWMRTLAREGLRRAAGLGRSFESIPTLAGDLACWAKALNDIEAFLQSATEALSTTNPTEQ